MDKLTAIKIKYDDGTYSDEIPISVLAENIEWDSTHTLVDILGSIDVDITGTIQNQISQLFNEKVSNSDMQAYITNSMPTYITNWLNTNVNPVGSAVVVDSSLTVSGAAADAKVTGEKLAILKGEFDEISEATNNLFNPYSITIGMNGAGKTGYPARALSEPIYVGTNGCYVKAYNLPENLKYGIEFYNTAETSSRVSGSEWQTTTGVYNYIRSEPYIRILFASVDNSSLTREDFVDLELMINLGSKILPYEQHLTATDDVARGKMIPVYNNLQPYGVIPSDGWIQGVYKDTGDFISHVRRITSDYIQVNGGDIYKPTFFNTNKSLAFHCAFFTSEKVFISREAVDHTEVAPSYVICPETAGYMRVTVRPFPDSENLYPTDATDLRIRLIKQTTPEKKTNITVMTYNVGKWNYGRSEGGIDPTIYDEKLTNLRRFFGKEECDIVGMQECYSTIDKDEQVRVNNVLFDYLYPYKIDTGNWESLKSKYPFAYIGRGQLVTSSRWYVYAFVQIGGKNVYLLNVHLSVGADSASVDKRIAEANEIIGMIKDGDDFKHSCIIFGDFNPEPGEEDTLFKVFADAGCNIANCGWFGKYFTWATNREDLDTGVPTGKVYYIDNIITSPDITIVSVEALRVFSELVSDHIPLKAHLSFD